MERKPKILSYLETMLIGIIPFLVVLLMTYLFYNFYFYHQWQGFKLCLHITIALILLFAILTGVYFPWRRDNHGSEGMGGHDNEPIPKISITARIQFITTLMMLDGIILSFFGGAAFMRGSLGLASLMGLAAIILSLIAGLFLFGYTRSGIDSETNYTIQFDSGTQQLLDKIGPWQFWLFVQGTAFWIGSIFVN